MNKATISKINDELQVRLTKLRRLEFDELKELDGNPTRESVKIGGKSFEFASWSERALDEPEGMIAVLVDTWKQNIVWSRRYIKGFLSSENGYVRELKENELWEYD